MTTLALDGFKSQFKFGGARANQFEVQLVAPSGVSFDGSTFSFYVKAASLPGHTVEEVAINYRGRILYIDGDRTFDTWSTTVMNDTDFGVRNALEDWMNYINNVNTNVSASGGTATEISSMMSDLRVIQFGRNAEGEILKEYALKSCWPTSVGPIELSWDTRNEVETFEVTWRYMEFEAIGA